MTTPPPQLIFGAICNADPTWLEKLFSFSTPERIGVELDSPQPKVITDHAVAAGGTCLPCMTFERIFWTRTHYFYGGRRLGRTYLFGEQSPEAIIPRSACTVSLKRIKE